MRSIGVRELKEQTTRILRAVREKGEEVEVTYRGRTVALLIPAGRARASGGRAREVGSDMDRLAREIRTRWPKRVSAVDAVRDARR
jgi:prevent-host-death family protein